MFCHNNFQPPNPIYPSFAGTKYLMPSFIQNPKPSSSCQKTNFVSLTLPVDCCSENSTSCGSEENNYEDLPDQMTQLQNAFNFNSNSLKTQPIQAKSLKQAATIIPEEAKYKTEMCKNWVETGKCNYGEKCKFAHGKNELVQKLAANKHFKTKMCKQFYDNYTCSYGSRCHFLHDVRSLKEIIATNFFYKRLMNPDIYFNLQSSSSSSGPKRLEVFNRISSTNYY